MYKGRFAPSPTGPLHQGSLVAAIASYLDARANNGIWQLRIDDIDPPRHDRTSFESIPHCLVQHGLIWDNALIHQSQRRDVHEAYLKQLKTENAVFTCVCTRSRLGPLGECRENCAERDFSEGSLRFSMPWASSPTMTDVILGTQAPASMPKNFVVRRKDGLIAYQLATAADDADEGYTHVIRGSDLLDSTFRQAALQASLEKRSPEYGHVPVLTDAEGNKLSKQHGAKAVNPETPRDNIRSALHFLKQAPPPSDLGSITELLQCAIQNWDRAPLNAP